MIKNKVSLDPYRMTLLRIELGRRAKDDKFHVEYTFKIGPDSDGINPRTEVVSFTIGTFSNNHSDRFLQVKRELSGPRRWRRIERDSRAIVRRALLIHGRRRRSESDWNDISSPSSAYYRQRSGIDGLHQTVRFSGQHLREQLAIMGADWPI